MLLIYALEPADARRRLEVVAEHTARDAAELRALLAREPEPGRGARFGFGRLTPEFGLRQYDAVHEWALDQTSGGEQDGVANVSARSRPA